MIAFLILVLLGIPLALLRGLVLSDLVTWFTPFHLGIVQAIGLTIIVTLFVSHLKTSVERQPGQSFAEYSFGVLLGQLLLILFAWGLGYIWHLFL
jgi:hypothetical protein